MALSIVNTIHSPACDRIMFCRREFVAAQKKVQVEVEECASTSTKIDKVLACDRGAVHHSCCGTL